MSSLFRKILSKFQEQDQLIIHVPVKGLWPQDYARYDREDMIYVFIVDYVSKVHFEMQVDRIKNDIRKYRVVYKDISKEHPPHKRYYIRQRKIKCRIKKGRYDPEYLKKYGNPCCGLLLGRMKIDSDEDLIFTDYNDIIHDGYYS